MAAFPENFEIPKWLYRRWIWHAAFWAVYIIAVVVEDLNSDFLEQSDILKLEIIAHLPVILTIYLTTLFGVPQLLYRKKYQLFALFCVSTCIVMSYSVVWLWHFLSPRIVFQNIEVPAPKLLANVSMSIFFVIFSASLKIVKDALLAAQRRADRASENLQGELLALRHQISPHFLLNSLNTIFGLALTEPKSVAPTVVMLSDLLRFSLYETHTDRISLHRELEFLHDFVQMQRLRASEKLLVEFDVPDNLPMPTPEVAPLLLLVFLENAFKYAQPNVFGDRFLKACIRFQAENKMLIFGCQNTFSEKMLNPAGGLGLENVRRRLNLIYPQKHRLDLRSEAGIWQVRLEINLEKT